MSERDKWRKLDNELRGKHIMLIEMEGEPQMPKGLLGIIRSVDDAGTIHVNWENGSGLGLLPDSDDKYKILTDKDIRKLKLNKLK